MPKKITKNRSNIINKISINKKYSLEESLSILKKISFTKFDESIDISINLNINTKTQNQSIKGVVNLPHKTGKKICILALITEDKESESKKLGASYVGLNFIEKIKNGWWDNNINVVIAMPSVMNKINSISKILGTKGLMPNPKIETVSCNPENSIKEIMSGKIIFKMDKFGIINSSIGRVSFSNKFLFDNIKTFIKKIFNSKPSSLKAENYIKNIYLSTTMSNSILLDIKNLFYNEKGK